MKWVTLANGRSVAVYDDAPLPARALNTQEPHDYSAPQPVHSAPVVAKAIGMTKKELVDWLDRNTGIALYRLNGMGEQRLLGLYMANREKAEQAITKERERIAKAMATRREWRGAEPLPDREVTGLGLCQGWRKGNAVAWIRKVA